MDMRAIFFANGPSFKKNYVNPWFKLVDEYQIFLRVLNIAGEEHQGDFERVSSMFINGKDETLIENSSSGPNYSPFLEVCSTSIIFLWSIINK